jgi:hypothetical protein
MSIGGVDKILTIPDHVRAADVILKVCQKHWPEGVLEDDSNGAIYSLTEAALGLMSRPEHEFFVYSDADAAKDWENEGATTKNANTMLHVLIKSPDKPTGLREVTVVFDELDEPMHELLSDLATQLQALPEETIP